MSRRPNVLALCRWFPPNVGGVETLLFEIYRRQAPGTVLVAAPNEPGSDVFDAAHSDFAIDRVGTPIGSDRKGVVFALAAAAFSQTRNGGLSQIHCGHVLLAAPAWLIARTVGLPYVVWTFGSDFTTTKFRRTRRFLMNGAAAVITISPGMRDELVELGVNPDRLVLISPGVDPSKFRPDPVRRERVRAFHGLGDHPLFVSVGRLHPNSKHKGFDTAIQAMDKVNDTNARLVIVGDGPDADRLKSLAAQSAASDRIIFAGRVSDDELLDWYAASDAFIQATRRERTRDGYTTEGFGIVFVEAQASGLPVITGRSGGASYAVGPQSGVLLDEGTPEALAQAVNALLADPPRLAAMGREAQRFANDQFAWEGKAAELARLIERVGPA